MALSEAFSLNRSFINIPAFTETPLRSIRTRKLSRANGSLLTEPEDEWKICFPARGGRLGFSLPRSRGRITFLSHVFREKGSIPTPALRQLVLFPQKTARATECQFTYARPVKKKKNTYIGIMISASFSVKLRVDLIRCVRGRKGNTQGNVCN